jgi:hypothetical protein
VSIVISRRRANRKDGSDGEQLLGSRDLKVLDIRALERSVPGTVEDDGARRSRR